MLILPFKQGRKNTSMQYLGIPRHMQSTLAYETLIENFGEFQFNFSFYENVVVLPYCDKQPCYPALALSMLGPDYLYLNSTHILNSNPTVSEFCLFEQHLYHISITLGGGHMQRGGVFIILTPKLCPSENEQTTALLVVVSGCEVERSHLLFVCGLNRKEYDTNNVQLLIQAQSSRAGLAM